MACVMGSFLASFLFDLVGFQPVEQALHFFEFGGRGGAAGESLKDEVLDGSAESFLYELAEQLPLGVFAGHSGAVDLGPHGFVALDEAFVGHDLEELEDGGVAGGFRGVEDALGVADGEGSRSSRGR